MTSLKGVLFRGSLNNKVTLHGKASSTNHYAGSMHWRLFTITTGPTVYGL